MHTRVYAALLPIRGGRLGVHITTYLFVLSLSKLPVSLSAFCSKSVMI